MQGFARKLKEGDHLEDLVVMGKMGWDRCKLDSSGTGYRHVGGFCEKENEPPDFIYFG